MVRAKHLLLPLLASCSGAYQISVAKSGGNVTTSLQYGVMEEVCSAYSHRMKL